MVFWLAGAFCMQHFLCRSPGSPPLRAAQAGPPISILKPVCGLEKNLAANLTSACRQEYASYEVIFALQRRDDPALAEVESVMAASPQTTCRLVIDERRLGTNGKVGNLHHALPAATGEIIVIADSDIALSSDYLAHLAAVFEDPRVGLACTLYRARHPHGLRESLALLSYNADFIPALVFAYLSGASRVCPGASMAIRRRALDAVGGLAPLCDHFVEDFELGRRVAQKGYRVVLLPHVVDMDIEVPTWRVWWRQQVAWDQKTRSARPWGFGCSLLLRGVPLALLYAGAGGPGGWTLLAAVLAVRLISAYGNAHWLGDEDGRQRLWLLPARDFLGLIVSAASLFIRKTRWRGRTFYLKKGKLLALG